MTKRKTAPAAERVGASTFDIDGLLAINRHSDPNVGHPAVRGPSHGAW